MPAPATPPIVVGATGGSGTRAVQAAFARAGVFMGNRVNHAGDAMDFEPWLDDAINAVLPHTRSLDYEASALPLAVRAPLLSRLRRIIDAFRAEVPPGTARWGWKNPRSMYILPLIVALQPDLSFVHVVRDGRDMALSDNQNQLNKHFAHLFGRPYGADSEVESIRLWSRANCDVARWAARSLGPRYVRLRLEDLCAEPVRALGRLFYGLGMTADLHDVASCVQAPPSLGRWREQPPGRIARIAEGGAEGLRAFGYV